LDATVSDSIAPQKVEDVEIRLLLEALYVKYHYDFRNYAMASIKRRLKQAREQLGFSTFSAMQESLLHDPAMLPRSSSSSNLSVAKGLDSGM
jgi:chemotaxis protein methyltransferase CheR